MKNYIYVYKVIYLKTPFPIKLTDNIFLYPSYKTLKERENPKAPLTYLVEFDLDAFSYVIIEKEDIIEVDKFKKDIELILTLFSVLLSNQFYYKENYQFILDKENNLSAESALIVPFPKRTIKKITSILFAGLHIRTIQEKFNDLYNNILKNPISDSLFYIVATLMACLRESIFEIKASFVWNVLEHMTTRYWKVIDIDRLYIIKKEKFDDYIEELRGCADNFLKNNIDKEKDVLLTSPYRSVYDYKNLLRQQITDNIKGFSPVKYKIFLLFENEDIPLSLLEKQWVKIMYNIRNWIHHRGLSLTEIKQEMIREGIDEDPIEFTSRFVAFMHRKILEFIGIVDKYAYFETGHLDFRRDEISKVEKEENSVVNNNLEEIKIVKKIDEIHNYLKSLRDTELEAEVSFNELSYGVKIKIFYDIETFENILRVINPQSPILKMVYSGIPTKDSLPEDIIRISQLIEFKVQLDQYTMKFLINRSPIDQKISIRFLLPRLNVKIKEDEEENFVDFNIAEIYISQN